MACSTTYNNSAQDYLDNVQEVCCSYNPCFFIPEVTTTTANKLVSFSLVNTEPLDVDWGDGNVQTFPAGSSAKTHTYVTPGKYVITFKIKEYGTVTNNTILTDTQYLTDIKQWGCLKISGSQTFRTATGATPKLVKITAIDTPKGLTNMGGMFSEVTSLTYVNNIEKWDTSNVTNMVQTFKLVTKFNQNINNWDTSNVTNMSNMFELAASFNQPLDSWNVAKVTNMSNMFQLAKSFNQPLNTWNVSNVTNMSGMFSNAISFNQPLNIWNVAKVTNMSGMFQSATSFNEPLNTWNVSDVTNMQSMFAAATSFNQALSNWNVAKVTNMSNMFSNAISFNQPLNIWNVSNVTNMFNMFQSATSFNQPLGNWNIINVTNISNFMLGKTAANYSAANYDATLIGWSTKLVKPNLTISFGNIKRTSASQTAYNILDLAPNNWTITDGGLV